MTRECRVCGDTLTENGGPQYLDGDRRQFYRCEGCGLGGWKTLTGRGQNPLDGPVFDGLRGDIAPRVARGECMDADAHEAAHGALALRGD